MTGESGLFRCRRSLARLSVRINLLAKSSSLASLIRADSFFSRPDRRSSTYKNATGNKRKTVVIKSVQGVNGGSETRCHRREREEKGVRSIVGGASGGCEEGEARSGKRQHHNRLSDDTWGSPLVFRNGQSARRRLRVARREPVGAPSGTWTTATKVGHRYGLVVLIHHVVPLVGDFVGPQPSVQSAGDGVRSV